MTPAPVRLCFRAVSMEFAAYLDTHTVEMHILTDSGQSIAVVCPRDSIFAIQRRRYTSHDRSAALHLAAPVLGTRIRHVQRCE